MDPQPSELSAFLATLHPYDSLDAAERDALAGRCRPAEVAAGTVIYRPGDRLDGVYVIVEGRVAITAPGGDTLSELGPRNSFGERGLLRDGRAATEAAALAPSRLLVVLEADLRQLIATRPAFARFFDRGGRRAPSLATLPISELMSAEPVSCPPDTPIRAVAALMRDRHVSSVLVLDGEALAGIVTTRDLATRAVAAGLPGDTPICAVMTAAPATLTTDALGADALGQMLERGIGHLPVLDRGRPVGMVTQTDLTRYQALTSTQLIGAIYASPTAAGIAESVARIPDLLVQLVGSGQRHDSVTRLITDIADAATRRLLALAEAGLGPPPVPYLWLACGSQGRQEQTGTTDQDNCLILHDSARPEHDAYFEALARFVADGLDACGYVHCPGDMMATNPRWRQPLATWRTYFADWIRTPDPTAQMQASVMFDLRPIGGEPTLFDGLNTEALAAASANSIFFAHMLSNALKHTPPLGLFRGLATVRSGEHKNTIDLKMQGVVPVVDLGRMYALQGRLTQVNTRARLQAAASAGILSPVDGRELTDAYDLIAETRLRHQAAQIRAGAGPDNFLGPATLSDLERSHLRDAFVVVRRIQSALGQGRVALT